MASRPEQYAPDPAILEYYGTYYNEIDRFNEGTHRLDYVRSKQILERYLPMAPVNILDVGGGPGAYSSWLAEKGHKVHLVDPVPRHLKEAEERARKNPLKSIQKGDARNLNWSDDTMDIVLLMGPLYHLTESNDRKMALREARRVLKSGGILFAVAITRFASLLDGIRSGAILDPVFRAIVARDLKDGQHRNPEEDKDYFTTAYFHRPEELAVEITGCGFAQCQTFAVEGAAWLLGDIEDQLEDPERCEVLLDAIQKLETEPSLLGASPHVMAVAEKP